MQRGLRRAGRQREARRATIALAMQAWATRRAGALAAPIPSTFRTFSATSSVGDMFGGQGGRPPQPRAARRRSARGPDAGIRGSGLRRHQAGAGAAPGRVRTMQWQRDRRRAKRRSTAPLAADAGRCAISRDFSRSRGRADVRRMRASVIIDPCNQCRGAGTDPAAAHGYGEGSGGSRGRRTHSVFGTRAKRRVRRAAGRSVHRAAR